MTNQPAIDDPDYPDPVVEEVRATRRRLAAECGNDLREIFADLRRRELESGRVYEPSAQPAAAAPQLAPPPDQPLSPSALS
ncbi:MAG: hypothetical protein ACRCT8_02540 [Lacipirellulaceae bacterium]